MATSVKTGTITGTAAPINVELGFIPDSVDIFNITNATHIKWVRGMGDGKGMKTVAAGTQSFAAEGGITPYDGSAATVGKGFTIGNDAQLNANGATLVYIAHRQVD